MKSQSDIRLKGITLFSGIGGAACGMQMAGVELVASVELDINNRAYSESCQAMSEVNFPGCKFYLNEIEEVCDRLPKCDILQASPVCAHFSVAAMLSGTMRETLKDTAMARHVATAIATCDPTYFFLEQVPGYEKSRSLAIILEQLKKGKYRVNCDTLNLADYGVPQTRKRFFLLASKQGEWRFPKPTRRMGWLEAIAGIRLEPSTLTSKQRRVLLRKIDDSYDLAKGILIQRYGTDLVIRRHTEPCWTLTRSSFTDGRDANRLTTINVVNGEGVWSLPMRAIARLGSFPDWFQLARHSGQGIGYSVPPRFVKQLLRGIEP